MNHRERRPPACPFCGAGLGTMHNPGCSSMGLVRTVGGYTNRKDAPPMEVRAPNPVGMLARMVGDALRYHPRVTLIIMGTIGVVVGSMLITLWVVTAALARALGVL